jgi:hypothetical protein
MQKMGKSERDQNERTHEELRRTLMMHDWNIGAWADGTSGVTLTFRKHYTSDAPGVETRRVHGKDEDDAIRTFLTELEAEAVDSSAPRG